MEFGEFIERSARSSTSSASSRSWSASSTRASTPRCAGSAGQPDLHPVPPRARAGDPARPRAARRRRHHQDRRRHADPRVRGRARDHRADPDVPQLVARAGDLGPLAVAEACAPPSTTGPAIDLTRRSAAGQAAESRETLRRCRGCRAPATGVPFGHGMVGERPHTRRCARRPGRGARDADTARSGVRNRGRRLRGRDVRDAQASTRRSRRPRVGSRGSACPSATACARLRRRVERPRRDHAPVMAARGRTHVDERDRLEDDRDHPGGCWPCCLRVTCGRNSSRGCDLGAARWSAASVRAGARRAPRRRARASPARRGRRPNMASSPPRRDGRRAGSDALTPSSSARDVVGRRARSGTARRASTCSGHCATVNSSPAASGTRGSTTTKRAIRRF